MDADDIRQLCQASAFDHPVTRIELIETHVSWVILTGRYAYKIKKPVDFGFLDFSTLEKRLFNCEEELRLNRRTSDQLYLAVVPVCRADGRLVVGGDGTVVEYAVKMRQFDPRATLLNLLQQGIPDLSAMARLGYGIGVFHRRAAVAEPDDTWGCYEAVAHPVRENFAQILPLVQARDRALILKLQTTAENGLAALKPLIETRKRDGFVRELHGDLHADNIARIDGQWVPFDCIEFNANLRWIDTASDIAFLVMDLEFRGFAPLANAALNAYLEYTGDYAALRLLAFYRAYRAMVRAKVNLLRWQQAQHETGLYETFLAYVRYCETLVTSSRPWLAITMGISGSGKSTLARRLCSETGAIHLRADAMRKRLFGMTPEAVTSAEQKERVYSAAASRQTFAALCELAGALLQQGFAVVVDATFIKAAIRAPFLQLARERNVPFAILCCEAPEEVLAERIQQRLAKGEDPSEADVAVMRNQLQQIEPLSAEERLFAVDRAQASWPAVLQELGLESHA